MSSIRAISQQKASDGAVSAALTEPLMHNNDPEAGTADAGTTGTPAAQPRAGRAARHAVAEETDASRSRGRWKIALYAAAALACGVLTFNFHYIIQVSHIHLSLAHSHRTSAFCAYVGCKLLDGGADVPAFHAAAPEVVAALSARVCGSPATDGYAHVIPKCLEESPTAVWWGKWLAGGGNASDLIIHHDPEADYDGLAVRWGIGNKHNTSAQCAAQCRAHKINTIGGPYEHLPCNAFSFCPFEKCFEPDAHTHTKGDCWLKFTEGPAIPEVNMRGVLPPAFRKRHATSPNVTQWDSGVLLPPGVRLTNGTWSPRWFW